MSGAASIPLQFLGLFSHESDRWKFAFLGFITAWICLVSVVLKIKALTTTRFKITCDPAIRGCKSISKWQGSRFTEWYMCLVETEPQQAIEDVRADLDRIEVIWEGPPLPFQLPFSPCGSTDSFSKTIRPETRVFFSVLAIEMNGNGKPEDCIDIGCPGMWPAWPLLGDIFNGFGTYRLKVTISGKDVPTEHVWFEFVSPSNALNKSSMRRITPPSQAPDKEAHPTSPTL